MKSLFDLLGQKKRNVQQVIGATEINDSCITVTSGDRVGFILITPVNLNVLSPVNVRSRITKMTNILEPLGNVDFICVNSTQDYDSNKHYLNKLKEVETNNTLRELDDQDIEFFDQIRVTMATSREFAAIFRFPPKDTPEHIANCLRTARSVMKDNGLTVRQAERTDLKRLLAIYFEQNIFEAEMQDFDGERYAKLLEMKA